MCWVSAIYAIVIAIVGEVLRPKTKFDKGKPAGTGDIDFPTSEAGRVFPWLCGTVKVLGPNVVAFTGLRNEKSQKKVKTGWFSSTKQLLGYRYYATLQMVYCGFSGLPGSKLGGLVGYQINDKFLKMTQNEITDHVIYVQIDDKSFNGDAKTEGGYAGLIRIYRGTDDQPRDFFLPGALVDPNLSAYPCVCYAVFQDFYLGMSLTSLPPIIPVLSAFHNSLGVPNGHEKINATANNVICAIYELLIDRYRGMGISPNLIDRPAFLAAAEVCFNEQIGVNVLIDSATTGRSALDDLQRYCDGQVFEDPFTGLWTITLARADYDIDDPDIIELNDDNSVVVDATKTSWADTRNTFTIKYTDKDSNWTAQSVQSQDMGNLVARDGQISAADLDYTAVDNAGLANFLAERARVGLATPLKQLTIEAQGTGSLLRINDVFRGKFPSKRIEKMALRVTDIEYPASDDGITTITAIEDKFGVAYVAYTATPDVSWTPPSFDPKPAAPVIVQEVPYGMAEYDGLADAARLLPAVMTAAGRSGGLEISYDLYATTPADSSLHLIDTVQGFVAYGTLVDSLPQSDGYTAFNMVISGVVDESSVLPYTIDEAAAGKNLFQIGNEIFNFATLTDNVDGTVTLNSVTRAVYDTIPEDHLNGAKVIFFGDSSGLGLIGPYGGNFSTSVKLPTSTGIAAQDVGDGTAGSATTISRAIRPYRPGAVTVNGVNLLSGTVLAVPSGVLSIAWARRNRIVEDRRVVAWAAPDEVQDAGTTYSIRVLKASDNSVVSSVDGITTNSATVTPGYSGVVIVQVFAQNGIDSYRIVQGRAALATLPLTLTGDAPDGTAGSAYSYAYTAAQGSTPYFFAIAGGTLPPGISLSSTGVLTGTPTTEGAYSWRVQVTDADGSQAFVDDGNTIAAAGALSIVGTPPDGTVGVVYGSSTTTTHSLTTPGGNTLKTPGGNTLRTL